MACDIQIQYRREVVGAIVSAIVLWPGSYTSAKAGGTDIDSQIKAVFQLASEGPETRDRAKALLQSLPRDQVIAWVVANLSGDSPAIPADRRVTAYWVLAEVRAAETPSGFQQLKAGVREPSAVGMCMDGLACTPPEKDGELMTELQVLLTDPAIASASKEQLLRKIGVFGMRARVCLPQITAIVMDTNQSDRVRSAGSSAMLAVGGLGQATEHVHRLDAVGEKLVMWSLTQYIGEHGVYRRDLSDEERGQIAAVVPVILKAMRSPDAETRQAGSAALRAVEGSAVYVIIRSRDDYEVHPEVKAILEGAAAHDPDPTIRERAAAMLGRDFVARLVDKTVRRREKERTHQQEPLPRDDD